VHLVGADLCGDGVGRGAATATQPNDGLDAKALEEVDGDARFWPYPIAKRDVPPASTSPTRTTV
jgi:hypothetical protein